MRAPRSWGAAERRRGARCGGAAALVGLLGVGCIFADDPENHPPLEVESKVLLYDYSATVASSGEVLASGCVASLDGTSFEEDLMFVVPLEQELVFEYRLMGRREGKISEEKPGDYYCKAGPTEEIGSAFHYNPQCFVVAVPERFEALEYEVIGLDGKAVDWESDDSYLMTAIGLRAHIVQHEYGIVGVDTDAPPCAGGWIGFYTAVPPEEE